MRPDDSSVKERNAKSGQKFQAMSKKGHYNILGLKPELESDFDNQREGMSDSELRAPQNNEVKAFSRT